MRADDIAALMVAGMQSQVTGNTDIGYHTGVVKAWDTLTGLNSVDINGVTFNNLKVLSTGDSIMLAAGDTVVIMRFQTQYFILGRVAAPGLGASLATRTARVNPNESTSSTTFTDLTTFGPTVPDVYIGSSRRCLVMVSATVAGGPQFGGYAAFEVTGASTIPAVGANGVYGAFTGASGGMQSSLAVVIPLSADDGLNAGRNTFTMKYRREASYPDTAFFNTRILTVIPY